MTVDPMLVGQVAEMAERIQNRPAPADAPNPRRREEEFADFVEHLSQAEVNMLAAVMAVGAGQYATLEVAEEAIGKTWGNKAEVADRMANNANVVRDLKMGLQKVGN